MTKIDPISDKTWNLPPAALIFHQQGSSEKFQTDLQQIVNMSLLSGVFPHTMKTAVIKPLLKKKNLDTPVMNN